MSESGHERARVTIPSFRSVFALERRIFRIGDARLPIPYGVPLAGIAWFAATLAAVLLARRLPVLGAALEPVPLPVLVVVVPAGATWALLRLRPDGRPAWRLLAALARALLRPRRLAAWRALPVRVERCVRLADVAVAHDAAGPRLRPARLRAPRRRAGAGVALVLRYPCEAWERAGALHVRQTSDLPCYRGTRIALAGRRRLVIEPGGPAR